MVAKKGRFSLQSSSADKNSVTSAKGSVDDGAANPERGQWSNAAEFVLSCLGYAMGLGNVWKFPYTCFSNGGGAYLIPYIIVLTFIGIPTFFLELIMGQYSGKGPIDVWCVSPIFKGVGFAMLLISGMICTFYTMILSYCLYYFAMCFQTQLPWDTCTHPYNTAKCYNYREAKPCQDLNGTWFNNTCYNASYFDSYNQVRTYCNGTGDGSVLDFAGNGTTPSSGKCYSYVANDKLDEFRNLTTKLVPSTQEYLFNGVLEMSDSINNTNGIKWELVLCLMAMWLLCFLILFRGIKSSGKFVYFSTTFPYLVMTILLIRSALLEGSLLGITYYLTPDWERLKDAKVWGDAAGQIFFALSVGCGGLLTYSSYNPFHSNLYRNSLMVAVFNSCTDWYAGFVVFSALGYMATIMKTQVKDVATDGAGLAFVVYPQVTASLPIPQLWSALFFFMLILLGIDSLTAGVEALITATVDKWEQLRRFKILVTLFWCSLFFLLGLPMCTRAGYYWLNLIAYYSSGWTLVVMGIIEIIVFAWIYGARKVLAHITEMVGFKLYPHWWICWAFISPALLMAVLIFNLVLFTPLTFNGILAPVWCQALGWLMTVSPLIIIIVFAIFKTIMHFRKPNVDELPWLRRVQQLFLPTPEWGPANRKKHTPALSDGGTADTAAAAAAAAGIDGIITPSYIPYVRDDDIEMKFSKSSNGGFGVDSINPCFIDDAGESPRSDGDGSSRAIAAANGTPENVPYSRANRSARDGSDGLSSANDQHMYGSAAL